MTLIVVKFREDLMIIYKVISCKTKWPHFFGLSCIYWFSYWNACCFTKKQARKQQTYSYKMPVRILRRTRRQKKTNWYKPKFHLARHVTFDLSNPRILAVSSLSKQHGSTRSSQRARHVERVETWRDEPSGIWAIQSERCNPMNLTWDKKSNRTLKLTTSPCFWQ